MENGVAAASVAMEKALRRLDAALASRAVAYRTLSEQHAQAGQELRLLREALQAAREEADSCRERAALVDALREELAAMQADAGQGEVGQDTASLAAATPPAPALAPAAINNAMADELAALQRERDDLKREREDLSGRLSAALAAQAQLKLVAERATMAAAPALPLPLPEDAGVIAALRADLAEARAAQAEAKAFEADVMARIETTMARLRRALAEPA